MYVWVWSIGGMILTGKTEVLGEKPVTVPLCQPQISQVLALHRTRTSAVWGWRLTAWAMIRSLKPQVHDIQKSSCYLTVHTQCFDYKKQAAIAVPECILCYCEPVSQAGEQRRPLTASCYRNYCRPRECEHWSRDDITTSLRLTIC
jgi:hypothetical protein